MAEVGEGSAAAHAEKPFGGKALPSQGLLEWKAHCLQGSQLCQSPPAPRGVITESSFGCLLHSVLFTGWERGMSRTLCDLVREKPFEDNQDTA